MAVIKSRSCRRSTTLLRVYAAGQELDVNILHGTYADEPQGDQPTRAIEFLKHAAWWTDGLYSELASMTLGLWKEVNEKAILRTMDQTLARDEGCNETLVGLLLMTHRFVQHAKLPQLLPQRLEECLLAFDYEAEAASKGEAGLDEDSAIIKHAVVYWRANFILHVYLSIATSPVVGIKKLVSNGRWHG